VAMRTFQMSRTSLVVECGMMQSINWDVLLVWNVCFVM